MTEKATIQHVEDLTFTSGHRETIKTAQQLASRMAQLAASTRELVNQVYVYEKPDGPLHKLYDNFRRVLIHDLSVDDFADMYAQTVTYGLFSARVTRTGKFALENVVGMIPNTNPFLRELLEECLKVGARTGRRQIDLDELGVGELIETLRNRNTDIEAVLRDFGRQSRDRKEDPVIHFYESFLREYDPDKKAKRGVFYTPDPVVSFIVRSVDYLLRTEFDCPDGLADTSTIKWKSKTAPKVILLDPAVGTGTFEKYVIELVYETFTRKHLGLGPRGIQKAWNEYVPKHLLPRLYGFELMMAPYAVAHMKLGLMLLETGYNFESGERLRIYLTNALQPAHEVPRVDTAFLAHEAEEANKVKTDMPVTVVIGNPPYSGHSANKGEWIGNLLRSYYKVDGKPLGEKNPKWLQDDYVKFIRYAQWRIEETGAGILAFITNHGYLDNPTFRGMRQQLMQTFSEIYVLNLHGNTGRQETAPDGSPDENVFDIKQGVSICLMVKHRGKTGRSRVFYAHLYGTRSAKYDSLAQVDVQNVEWQELTPLTPFYMFVPQEVDLQAEYDLGWQVTAAMPVNSVNLRTHRDALVIDFDKDALTKRIAHV